MSKMKKIIIAAANVLLLALIAVCVLRCYKISGTLLSQQAAERWAGEREERFAQISCFYPVDGYKTESEIRSFRETIDKKLADAGVETPTEGSYWTDAYAAISTVSTTGERGNSEATALGIGGDFFLFHPYELLSGSYISDDDVMKDRVVIDRELAWKLYGGTELEGMTLEVNGKTCYIAGVISRETDKYSQRCFSEKPLIFMHCSALNDETNAAAVSCYEMVMLDPISGFAEKTVREGMASDTDTVIENSKRYSFGSILKIFEDFGARSIQTKAIAYPYWENASRITEDYIARIYVIIALLAVFPLICAVVLLVKLIMLLSAKLKRLKARAKDAWEDRYGIREELREKRAAKKAAAAAEGKPKRKLRLKRKPKAEKKAKTKHVSGAAKTDEHADESAAQPMLAVDGDYLPDIESIVNEVLNEKQSQ